VKRLLPAFAAVLALAAACDFLTPADRGERGSVVVRVPESLAAAGRTVAADFSKQLTKLEVTVFSSVDGSSQTRTVDKSAFGDQAVFTDVYPGNCVVTVVAYIGDLEMGDGSAAVVLAPGGSVGATVQLAYRQSPTGTGDFAFTFAWPDAHADWVGGEIFDAAETSIGNAAVAINPAVFKVDGTDYRLATLSGGPLVSGAYTLALTFRSGGASGTIVGYALEALNIWDGFTSDRWIDDSGLPADERDFSAAELHNSTTELAHLTLTGLTDDFFQVDPATLAASADLLVLGDSISFTPTGLIPGQRIYYDWNSSGTLTAIGTGLSSGELAVSGGGDNLLEISVFAPSGHGPRTYSLHIRKAYSVDFDLNDGDPAIGDFLPPLIVAKGDPALKPADPTRYGGFDFAGWYTDEPGQPGAVLWDFDAQPVTADMTLHAKWTGGVTVGFDLEGDYKGLTLNPAAVELVAGETTTFSCADPDLAGLVWTWYVDGAVQAGQTAATFEYAPKDPGDYTVSCRVAYGGVDYAATALVTMSDGYTLSYSGNGADSGGPPSSPIVYAEGDDATVVGNFGGFAKSGFAFAGWAYSAGAAAPEPAFTAAALASATGAFSMPDDDVVLYAVWEDVAPAGVSNLRAEVGDGYIDFSWDDPADVDLAYVRINWTVAGTPYSKQVGAGTRSKLIFGLADDFLTWYPFTFTCFDAAGNASALFTAHYSLGRSTPVALAPASTGTVLVGVAGEPGCIDGDAATARIESPFDITTDGTYLYFSDFQNFVIRRAAIDDGAVETIAGQAGVKDHFDGDGAAARFDYPFGVATDGEYLYVAENQLHTIRRIGLTAQFTVETIAGTAGASGPDNGSGAAARFNLPACLATDGAYLYVADAMNHTIRRIDLGTGNFEVITLAGAGVADVVDDPDGDANPATIARFNTPIGLATDGLALYVSDHEGHTIRKIDLATRAVTTIAGTAYSPGADDDADGYLDAGTAARFDRPSGLATDGANLYIADQGNGAVRRLVLATGVVTTITTGLASPVGLTLAGDALYVADQNANRLVRISP
jgi:sugar lactone lactonase YvrE